MPICIFRETIDQKGEGHISQWLSTLSHKAQAQFDNRIHHLAQLSSWSEPHFKRLVGHEKLGEVRFKAERMQYRAIGFNWTHGYVLTVGCYHKQKIYDPRDAIAVAARNMKLVFQGTMKTKLLVTLEDEGPRKDEE
jgi:phage-related protein